MFVNQKNKMVKIFKLGLVVFSMSALAQTNSNFTISGTLKNVTKNNYVYLHHKWDNKDITDSVKTKSGVFLFKGKVKEANMFWITKTNNIAEQPNLIFFVDGGKTVINGSIDSLPIATIVGGQTQKDYQDYNNTMRSFAMQQQAIVTSYNDAKASNDGNTMNAKYAEYQALELSMKTAVKDFIKAHSKSAVSGYAIYYNYQNAPNVTPEELESVVNLMDKSLLTTKYGKLGQEKLNQMRGSTIGYPATNFAQADPNGKLINLTDFKGKYVLVDFWASWCGPCRGENPNVVRAFNQYKDKGFTVFGVSFDQNKEKWLQAVEKDGLTWAQVSDLKGWGNEAGKLFGITSIPQNLLLDKEGKIIAKNLRGAELDAKLEELLK